MGIEHPILGLLTFTIIAAMLVTAMVLLNITAMNVQDFILKTPITEGYASCYSESSGASGYEYRVGVVVANTGRVDIKLERLYIATDKGILELSVTSSHEAIMGVIIGDATVNVEITLLGFTRDTELWAGQRGFIALEIASNKKLYTEGATYTITAYLKTMDLDAFTTREARFKPGELGECPIITPPAEPPLTDIILQSRSALYSDTFDIDPIGTRMIEPDPPCRAGHQPGELYGRGGLVYIESPSQDRECALLVQGLTIPDEGTVYVAFTALIYNSGVADQPALFGAILTADESLTRFYAGGFDPDLSDIFVRVVISTLSRDNRADYSVMYNKWYNGTLALTYAIPSVPQSIKLYADPEDSARQVSRNLAPGELLIPLYAGLTMNKLTSPRLAVVYFDSVLVTHNAVPWIVRVEGLQPGWRVELWDGSRLVDSKIAAGGFVDLSVWGRWIITGGTIKVYYDSNVLSKTFSVILGGDVYRVVGS